MVKRKYGKPANIGKSRPYNAFRSRGVAVSTVRRLRSSGVNASAYKNKKVWMVVTSKKSKK